MIGKQTKGRGFRKLLDYLESREDAQLIGGNMSGRNARELAREFKLSRQLNSDADRVVYHVSLSAAKGDKLDDEKWNEIGDRYMKEMGFDANQFVIFRHHNTDDDHIHIAASRIRMDTGLLVHDSWDYVRSEKVLRQIEQDYELVQVQGSREKLNRTPSTGQIRRIRREQEEYSLGQRDSPPERTIKEQVQQIIDNASVDHPQMPLFIMRLQVDGISVKTGFTRNGKSKGISYEKDRQAFSGTQLGAAYTFPGLQKHLLIDYQPQRDDARIKQLLNNRVGRTVENQEPINAIAELISQSIVESTLVKALPQLTEQLDAYQQQLANNKTTFDDFGAAIAELEQRLSSQRAVDAIADFIEQSIVESALVEALPQLTEQLYQYRQQLANNKTTLDDFGAAIADIEQRLSSQKAVDAVADFIEQSVVESALVETLPQLTEQLFGYWQQLKASKTAFNDFETALTAELQSHAEKRAILSISDYVDQSAIESALTQTVLGLTEQLSAYQQQLQAGRTTFDDLEAVIVYLEQLHSEQITLDANALNKAQIPTTDKPKLTPNQTAELYKYYGADLQDLLVTDRDKEIAIRALLDNKPALDVEEIIFASPAGWTTDEAKALVLIANNQLAHLQEQPQFSPPEENESLRRVLHYYLTQQRGITNFLVQPLQRQGLAYIDQQEKVVFIKRDLDGEKSGALVWDTARIDNRCTEYPENSDRSQGWFHFKLGGEADDKIERVYLCSSPIDALTMAEIDREGHKGQPPVRTMYMAVDSPDNLPFEVLRNISRIGLAFNNDDQGNEAAQVVHKMLPQAKRIAPKGLTWNEILVRERQQQQEMLEQKQRSRGFSR